MKSNNTDQFLNMYNEYVDGVFRFCFYKTSDREVALDITQDVFAKIWEYMKKGGTLDNKKAFIFSTANRKVIDWYRSKKPNVSLDMLSESGIEFKTDATVHGIQLDGRQALEKVKELDVIYRDVLLLRYVDELSVKEIAQALDETENNISVRLHRAMEKLKTIYFEQENKLEKN